MVAFRPRNWVLNTYDYIETVQGTDTSRTDFCFERLETTGYTGFLQRRRVRRGIAGKDGIDGRRFDLLTVFTPTLHGNVQTEAYSGGDGNALPAASLQQNSDFDTCNGTATPRYTLTHQYSYGVRSSTEHSASGDPAARSLDLIIDPTGIPSGSIDVSREAALTTRYVYNALGQITEVRPPGEASTTYMYSVDRASAPHGTVTVQQRSPVGNTLLTDSRYYYDSRGRLVQQRSWMGSMGIDSNTWSAVKWTYDDVASRKTKSVPVGVASSAWGAIAPPGETVWQYDPLGRVRKITQPDTTNATDVVYTGATQVARTATIATAAGDSPVTTLEGYDALGRLVSVTEDSEDAPLETFYQYDEGDRLVKVTAGDQIRVFDYDGAGLLRSEDHPESDVTTYEYDARGHMTKKVTGTSTLQFVYDDAERLTTVLHDPDGPGTVAESALKQFVFGSSSGVGLHRLGTATRHNYHPDLGGDISVVETFTYSPATGRLSSKATAVTMPSGSVRTFTDSYTYDPLGATETITYPGCSSCGSPPARIVTNTYTQGYLDSVSGFATGIRYHPNGMWATFSRPRPVGSSLTVETQTLDTNKMPRPASLSVTGYCASFAVSAPTSSQNGGQNDYDLSVTAPAGSTFQWYAGSTPISGATAATVHVTVQQTTSYWVRVGKGTCTVDSSEIVLTPANCAAPPPISAPASVNLGGSGTASLAATGTYSWSITNGSISGSTSASSVAFTVGCAGSSTLTVVFTPSCGGGPVTLTKSVSVFVPAVTLTANPSTIAPGAASTITAAVSGTGSWTVSWADGMTMNVVSGSAARAETPSATTTYTVTQVNGCSRTPAWPSVTVTVSTPPPPAPVTTTATKNGAASVMVAWTIPAGATIDSYRVERCATSCTGVGSWVTAGTTAALTFSDSSVATNSAYAYRVVSIKSGTESTSASPPDFASTYAFTDDPLPALAGQKALHMSQLRAAVNALRATAGLAAYSYTEAVVAGSVIAAQHFLEVQTALNQARAAFNGASMTFAPPAPQTGGLIFAAHVNALRGGVQ